MSKKLQGNGLWASSRMMLPEHREQLLEQNRHRDKPPHPTWDEQGLALLECQIIEAFEQQLPVRLLVLNRYEETEMITGRIQKVDTSLRRIRIVDDESVTWIRLDDVVGVE